METLPSELIELILDRCEHSAQKNLRLVNHAYHEAATPFVFQHIYFAIFDDCHEKLVSISKSRFARHVTHMTIYLDLLPEWSDSAFQYLVDYREDIMHWIAHKHGTLNQMSPQVQKHRDELPFELPDPATWEGDRKPYHGFTSDQLEKGGGEYRAARRQQLQWHESRQGALFKEHFAMLPNLQVVACIQLTARTPREKIKPPAAIWRRMRRKILLDPYYWTCGPWGDKSHIVHEFARRVSFLALEAIAFRASFSGTKPITSFKLDSHHVGPWERMSDQQTGELTPLPDRLEVQRRFNLIREGFQQLKKLHWRLYYDHAFYIWHTDLAVRDTKRLLHAATQLRSLTLVFIGRNNPRRDTRLDNTGPGNKEVVSFLDSKPPWPHLQKLRLCIDAHYSKFIPFFKHLSPSLRSFELMESDVEDARALIVAIPQILSLDYARLERIWYRDKSSGRMKCLFEHGTDVNDPTINAVREYLIGKAMELPDLEPHATPFSGPTPVSIDHMIDVTYSNDED